MADSSSQGPSQKSRNQDTGQAQDSTTAPRVSKVANAAGNRWDLLPGESADKYEEGLISAIYDLDRLYELDRITTKEIASKIYGVDPLRFKSI